MFKPLCRYTLIAITAFVTACGNTSSAATQDGNTKTPIHGETSPDNTVSLGAHEAILIIDGKQASLGAGLFEEVMKEIDVKVPYEGTCTRTVPDGTREECHTEYRTEQECGYENVCSNEQVCNDQQQCSNENVCHNERQCSVVPRCSNETVCDTKEECSVTPNCRDERKCEVVNGRRECSVERVCENERSCHSTPVCRTEQRCTNERECSDVPRCETQRQCRTERSCHTVPSCNNEYQCKNVQVPYPVCEQVPDYREEEYSCTKHRTEKQIVLDYKHTVVAEVSVDVPAMAEGVADILKLSTVNGELKLIVGQNNSGLTYLASIQKTVEKTGSQERTTKAVIKIKALAAEQVRTALDAHTVTATKTAITVKAGAEPLPQGLKLAAHLLLKKVRTAKIETTYDKDLKDEYLVDAGRGETTISFKKVGLSSKLTEKRKWLVTLTLSVKSTEGFTLLEPAAVSVEKNTEFSTK